MNAGSPCLRHVPLCTQVAAGSNCWNVKDVNASRSSIGFGGTTIRPKTDSHTSQASAANRLRHFREGNIPDRSSDRVRQQRKADFCMNPGPHKDKPGHSRFATIFTLTLVVFYIFEILLVSILA